MFMSCHLLVHDIKGMFVEADLMNIVRMRAELHVAGAVRPEFPLQTIN